MHGKYFLQLLCCLFMVTTFCSAIPQLMPGQAELEAVTRRMAAKNILDYKATCSFEDEKRRLAIGEKLLNMAYDLNFDQLPKIASDFDELIRNSKGDFCNGLENLQCTSEGLCDCASGDMMGMTIRSVRENNVCRLVSGSDCVPESSEQAKGLRQNGMEKTHLDCQRNSQCMFNHDKMIPCTETGFQRYLLESYGGVDRVQKDPFGFMRFSKNKIAEGVCSCSGGGASGVGTASGGGGSGSSGASGGGLEYAAAQNISPGTISMSNVMLGGLLGILLLVGK